MILSTRGERMVLPIVMSKQTMRLVGKLEGSKKWLLSGGLSFVPTPHNLSVVREAYPESHVCGLEDGAPQASMVDPHRPYTMRTKPYAAQSLAFELCKDKPAYALFMEQGTGKTKVALDKAGHLWCTGQITGVLVVSMNGAHRQWVEEHVPKHLGVESRAGHWNKKAMALELLQTDKLAIFTTYTQAIIRPAGRKPCDDFIAAHCGRVLMVVDESQNIKNPSSSATEAATELGSKCAFRMVLSGTPMPNSVMDLWSQYKFLEEGIIGFRYKSAFQREYCVMGGYMGRSVIGAKDMGRLQDRLRPFTFRVTKEEMLDLPPKIYNEWSFEMDATQKKHSDDMRLQLLTQMQDGSIASAKNAIAGFVRLQQISCGNLQMDNGALVEISPARIDALKEIIELHPGEKIVIWSRFTRDVQRIMGVLGDEAVAYTGETSEGDKAVALRRFIDPESPVRFFVSNPAAGGTGIDGLQKVCSTVIYYSNSFNAGERWQSEDRTHRHGTTKHVVYYDLIAKGRSSIDRRILGNLRNKKNMSDLTLDELKEMLSEQD